MNKIELSLFDILVLLDNIYLGAKDKYIGFEDADRTMDELIRELNKRIAIPQPLVESALWSCNLLDEKGKFSHKKGLTFNQFLSRIIKKGKKFNKDYNVIEDTDE